MKESIFLLSALCPCDSFILSPFPILYPCKPHWFVLWGFFILELTNQVNYGLMDPKGEHMFPISPKSDSGEREGQNRQEGSVIGSAAWLTCQLTWRRGGAPAMKFAAAH